MSISLEEYAVIRAKEQKQHFVVMDHIREMFYYLELCFIGDLPGGKKNLLINIPPRHAKTETVRIFIEWVTGRLPDCEWIYASNVLDLSKKSTTAIRTTMQAPWYQEMFPACILQGSLQQRYFETSLGGCVYAVGAGGTIIGYGAGKTRPGFGGAFIIDDPLKPKDATAASKIEIMNAQVDYTDTFKTRRNSDHTPIIEIMQRLHPEDPAGYVLKNEPDDWYHLKIPIFKEDGSMIWPGRISEKELLTEKEVNPFKFYGQYMQEPTTPGGTIIKEKWWNYFSDIEEVVGRCNWIAVFGDTAMKKEEANDYSVFQVWGFEGIKRAYLLDQLRGKWEFPELILAANAIWNKWQDHPLGKNAKMMFVEDKASGTQLVQFEKQSFPIEPWVPDEYDAPNDKPSRVQNAAFMVFGDQVWLPNPDEIEGMEWVEEFVEEASLFRQDDTHSHDDMVDTFTMAVLTWRSMGGGYVYKEAEKE